MLVYESMLASVIIARDKWLKPVSISHLLLSPSVILQVLYNLHFCHWSFCDQWLSRFFRWMLTVIISCDHHRHVAGEGCRVVASPCPWSTARLLRSPVGWVESYHSWSSHLFCGRPRGRRHMRSGGRLSVKLMWSWRAMFAGVSSSSQATCPNTEIRYDTRCYFNVRWKADMSRLNLPHGNDN